MVVANLAKGPDGRWSAPDGRPLYAWATALGAVYRAQLRAELAEMGLVWDHRPNGLAEVSAIPKEILRAFSRRRAEIEADQARSGSTSQRSAEVAQRRTRAPKDPALASAPDGSLRQRWADQLAALVLHGRPACPADITAAIDWARPLAFAGPRTLERINTELVAPPPDEPDVANRSLTAHASTFSRRDVIKALAAACPSGAEAVDLMEAASELVSSEAVVPLLPLATDPAGAGMVAGDVIRTRDGRVLPALPADRRYSTQELLGIEESLISSAAALRGTGVGRVHHRQLVGMLAGAPELSADQRAVVASLCRSGHGIQLVEGPAGSGKTTALRVARLAWEAEGYRVIGAAAAARAAFELQRGSGITSGTLHRLLADLDRPGGGLAPRSVVVVDEAGMVGTRMLAPPRFPHPELRRQAGPGRGPPPVARHRRRRSLPGTAGPSGFAPPE
ncbi:MAG: AAA family ATPase [Acidimicrobiales bacterium]